MTGAWHVPPGGVAPQTRSHGGVAAPLQAYAVAGPTPPVEEPRDDDAGPADEPLTGDGDPGGADEAFGDERAPGAADAPLIGIGVAGAADALSGDDGDLAGADEAFDGEYDPGAADALVAGIGVIGAAGALWGRDGDPGAADEAFGDGESVPGAPDESPAGDGVPGAPDRSLTSWDDPGDELPVGAADDAAEELLEPVATAAAGMDAEPTVEDTRRRRRRFLLVSICVALALVAAWGALRIVDRAASRCFRCGHSGRAHSCGIVRGHTGDQRRRVDHTPARRRRALGLVERT
jgi:hypothetical protein